MSFKPHSTRRHRLSLRQSAHLTTYGQTHLSSSTIAEHIHTIPPSNDNHLISFPQASTFLLHFLSNVCRKTKTILLPASAKSVTSGRGGSQIDLLSPLIFKNIHEQLPCFRLWLFKQSTLPLWEAVVPCTGKY